MGRVHWPYTRPRTRPVVYAARTRSCTRAAAASYGRVHGPIRPTHSLVHGPFTAVYVYTCIHVHGPCARPVRGPPYTRHVHRRLQRPTRPVRVWGTTPAHFNGFRVLTALLHGTTVVPCSNGRAAITLGIGPHSSYGVVPLVFFLLTMDTSTHGLAL